MYEEDVLPEAQFTQDDMVSPPAHAQFIRWHGLSTCPRSTHFYYTTLLQTRILVIKMLETLVFNLGILFALLGYINMNGFTGENRVFESGNTPKYPHACFK